MARTQDIGLTRVGFYVLVDIIFGWVAIWTTPKVLLPLPLVYPNVVDQHFRGKGHGSEVDRLPAWRHTQVENQRLKYAVSKHEQVGHPKPTIGSSGMSRRPTPVP